MTATIEGPPARRVRDDEVEHPVFTPSLPRVNLLPASVTETFTVRRIRRVVIGIAILVVAGFASVWYLQAGQVATAQDRLAQAQADNATVAARVDALAPIKQMYEQITGEQNLVATTLASEPRAALVISRLVDAGRSAVPGVENVAFSSIVVEYRGVPDPGAEINPCPNPDPFATDITIGCVEFSGTASTRSQVSDMLTAIANDPLFVGPYVNNSTVTLDSGDTAGGVMFTGTAGVALEALKVPLTDEKVNAILHPPTPDPDADPNAAQSPEPAAK